MVVRAKAYYAFNYLFFFQAEDGIRDLVRSRGLGDVYKRQIFARVRCGSPGLGANESVTTSTPCGPKAMRSSPCLLYTSDAADERSSVDLGGRRIIKKKNIDSLQLRVSPSHTTAVWY